MGPYGLKYTVDKGLAGRTPGAAPTYISISDHFSQWAGLGLPIGDLEEAKLFIAAQHSTGTIDFTTATVGVQ
jgi:hypothetical protein